MPSYFCIDASSSTRFVSAYNELLRCLKLRGGCLETPYKTWNDAVTQSDLNAMRSAMYTMGHIQFIDMAAVNAALAVSSDQPSTLFTDNYLWKDVTDSTPFFLTSVSAGNTPVCAYTLNAKDQRTSSSLADGSSWAYGYDSRSQLASAVKSLPGVPDESFGYLYDDIGNRPSSTEGGVTRAYTANNLNQYTAITNPSVSPTHDGDGNMTSDGEWQYTWNADNRLVAIENATHREEYDYDYMGRRWRLKTFTKSGNAWVLDSEKLFVYDGYRQIAEFTMTGTTPTLTATYLWQFVWYVNCKPPTAVIGWHLPADARLAYACMRVSHPSGICFAASSHLAGFNCHTALGLDGCILRATFGTATRYFIPDGNRNIIQLRDASGAVTDSYAYGPFGQCAASGATPNPFRFSCEYLDAATGLVYYNYRHYHSSLGRWTSRDPVGEMRELNMYCFTDNDSCNTSDILGLLKIIVRAYKPGTLTHWYRNRLQLAKIDPETARPGSLLHQMLVTAHGYKYVITVLENYYSFTVEYERSQKDCICLDKSLGEIHLGQRVAHGRYGDYGDYQDDGFTKKVFSEKGQLRIQHYLSIPSPDDNLYVGGIKYLTPGSYLDLPHDNLNLSRKILVFAICSCPCEDDYIIAQAEFCFHYTKGFIDENDFEFSYPNNEQIFNFN